MISRRSAASSSLERARTGGGPTFVESLTYRMGAHTTSDDPSRYRTSEQEELWRRRDPIDRLRTYLETLGELPEVFQAELADEADALGERLRTQVRAMGRPSSSRMFEHVYATPHAVVEAERQWFEGYESSFEGSAR